MDDEIGIVVLCRFISADGTAFFALMNNDKSFFGVRLRLYRTEDSAAVRGSVPRVDVQMEGGEAIRAVVSGGIAEGRHFPTAARTEEAVVVFCKSFVFQWYHLIYFSF